MRHPINYVARQIIMRYYRGMHKHCAKYITPPATSVTRQDREQRQGHRGAVFWLTGPSGAGKSTLAHAAEKVLFDKGMNVAVLDGDRARSGLCGDLGFSPVARQENLRRVAHLARIFVEQGIICLCSFISPAAADRGNAREIVGPADFSEIYVSCPFEVCERRDCKGFYKLARKGVIKNYTGVSSPYEAPEAPDLVLETDQIPEDVCTDLLARFIISRL